MKVVGRSRGSNDNGDRGTGNRERGTGEGQCFCKRVKWIERLPNFSSKNLNFGGENLVLLIKIKFVVYECAFRKIEDGLTYLSEGKIGNTTTMSKQIMLRTLLIICSVLLLCVPKYMHIM